jgi:hypothetical protein
VLCNISGELMKVPKTHDIPFSFWLSIIQLAKEWEAKKVIG